MIFKGKKVLDGTLDSIQAQYPANVIKCRVEDFPADGSPNEFGESAIPEIDGTFDVEFNGRYHTFRIEDPEQTQLVLNRLSSMRKVSHFEVVKPSLHDIFVQIARPHQVEDLESLRPNN